MALRLDVQWTYDAATPPPVGANQPAALRIFFSSLSVLTGRRPNTLPLALSSMDRRLVKATPTRR